MAKLFKDKTIKKNLEKFEIPNFEEKLGIVNKWLEAYKNKTLHRKTESQCEQAFNQSFFVELLGYTTFPNTNYTIEPKATTDASGQKPDAALGYYEPDKSRTIAVVEVKDVNTALDRSQKREGNLSPVQQAFKYKPQFKECIFVIASNFYEIRLHKDNQLDYEQFTLESLADPKDNYFELRKFYYLLCADNFISKAGKTKTEALLSDIRVDQEKITKKFYQEYKLLRQSLIKDIVQHNSVPKSELLLIIEKAQKIIDRIVFVCFCEDTDLLPEDTLQTVIKHAESSFSNQWDILKGFFNAIDSGSEKLEIPHGYNGGLFAEDSKLNSLKISDDVCKQFLEFGKYDFSEDLSVNILGHIFEQSISDIEEIKSRTLEGEEADKKSSKRKKEGIFYTPDYIVDYIVKNSLGKYLEEKEAEIKEKNNLKEDINDVNYKKRALTTYIEYQSALRNVKVLDPACGSGAFLVKVFDYLLAENIRVANIIADLNDDKTDLFSSENYIKSLLENNIFGVDLNPESVEITKLSLWLKSAQKDKRLVNLKNNIKCGNSLIDDPTIAGNRAFKWENEFKEIMENGGFDVVVGNPPYGATLSNEEKIFFKESYSITEYNYDTYNFFYERSLKLLKKGGYLGFITPNTFLVVENGTLLRRLLFEDSRLIELYETFNVFPDAVVEPVSIIVMKEKPSIDGRFKVIMDSRKTSESLSSTLDYNIIFEKQNLIFNYRAKQNENRLYSKLKEYDTLAKFATVTTGIKPYQVGKGIPKQTKETIKEKPYTGYVQQEGWYPIVRGTQINRYNTVWDGEYINYGKWLAEPRKPEIFFNPKLFIRRTDDKLLCSYDEQNYIGINSIHCIQPKSEEINCKFLLALINSRLCNWFFQFENFHMVGKPLAEVKVVFVERLPIIALKQAEQNKYIEKVNKILDAQKEFQRLINKFLKLIQSEFHIDKVGKKLEKFYELSFEAFIKEIKTKGLNLERKAELLDFFEKSKTEILNIKAQINKTDKEIDDMVFELYGLTEKEKEIVINN